jgi:hypothetical protein
MASRTDLAVVVEVPANFLTAVEFVIPADFVIPVKSVERESVSRHLCEIGSFG